eukprot:2439628-Ditylum_brightwellii.AAC.1
MCIRDRPKTGGKTPAPSTAQVNLNEKSDLPPAVAEPTENPPVQTKTTVATQDPAVEVPGLLSK